MTVTLNPPGREVNDASTVRPGVVRPLVGGEDAFAVVAHILGQGLTGAAVSRIADRLTGSSSLSALRARGLAQAESADYEDDAETLADQAAFTLEALDVQRAVIAGMDDGDQ